MSRVEMMRCDLEGCDREDPNPTDGWTSTKFDGRIYDFCSGAHGAKWEKELVRVDLNRRKRKTK